MVRHYPFRKDGFEKWANECAGYGQSQCGHPDDKKGSPPHSETKWSVKEATSFGQPFTTHAMLCENHRIEFGYRIA